MADTPATQNPDFGKYNVASLAAEIRKRRPDLTPDKYDDSTLVRGLVSARPEFQSYLDTDSVKNLFGYDTAPPKGFVQTVKETPGMIADFFKKNFQAATTPAQTPEEKQIASVTGNRYSGPVLWAHRMGVAPFEAEKALAEQAGAQADPLGVIQHSAQAATSLFQPVATVAPAQAFRSVFVPQVAGQAAQQVGSGNVSGAAGTIFSQVVAPELAGRAIGAALKRRGGVGTTGVTPEPTGAPDILNAPTTGAPSPQIPPTAAEASGTSTQANAPATAPITPARNMQSLADFRGAEGPMRPWDPTGERFQTGKTPDLGHISAETPQQAASAGDANPAKQLDPVANIKQAGLVNKGELFPGSNVYQLEHPDYPGITAAVKGEMLDSPDAAQTAINRKLAEFGKSPELLSPNTTSSAPSDPNNAPLEAPKVADPLEESKPLVSSFDMESFHNKMSSVERAEGNLASEKLSPMQRSNWEKAVTNLRNDFKSDLSNLAANVDPSKVGDIVDQLQTESGRLRDQVKEINDVRKQDETAKAMRQEMAVRPVRPWREGALAIVGDEASGGFQEIGKSFPGELRDAFHQILGDKVKQEGGNYALTDEDAVAVREKAKASLAEIKDILNKRMEDIATRRGDADIPRADLVSQALREEKLYNGRDLNSEIRDLQSLLGTSRERLRYVGKGEPVTDEGGVVRAPGQVKEISLKWANGIFDSIQKPLRKLPTDEQWDAHVANIERRATFLENIATRLSAKRKVTSESGFIGEQGQGGHAGGGVASVEELNRPGRFVKVSRSGALTDQGKTPDFTLKPGEAGYQVRPDGTWELKAGEESPATKLGIQNYAKEVFGARRAQRGAVSGTELMASSAIGASAGAYIGHKIAGAPGALVGGALGYVGGFALPALYRNPHVVDVLDNMGRELKELGFDAYGQSKELTKSLVNFLAPTSGVRADQLDPIMKMKGDIAASKLAAANALDVFRKHVDALNRDQQIDFIDRMKTGQPQVTPELEALAGTIRTIDADNYNKITLFKPGLNFLEDHFRLLYKELPGQNQPGGFQGWLGKRPLAGSKGFLNQQVYSTLSDAMQAGGVPVTTNPIDLFLLGHADVARYVHANMLWEEMKNNGAAQFVKSGKTVPPGFVALDDRISQVYFPAKSGEGMVQAGKYYVDENMGRLLNNFLSKDDIRANVIGRKIVDFKNISNGWELFGGFHAQMINTASLVQNLNNAAQRMYNLGVRGGSRTEFLQGVKDLASAPVELMKGQRPAWLEGKALEEYGKALDRGRFGDQRAVTDFLASDRGKELLKQYPNAEELLKDAHAGGLNLHMASDLRSDITKNMLQDFQNKNYIQAGMKAVPSALYEANKPLFEWYIPRIKLGMFMRDMSIQLKDRAPELMAGTLTRPELAREVTNRIDNIFGEMNFDNRFWSKNLKTSLQLIYRSVTWRLGTGKILAGGLAGQTKDIISAVKQGELPRLNPNFGFVGGALLTLGVTAAVIQKLATGQNPQGITDLTHPKVGGVNENGKPNRLNIPGYGTEFLKIGKDPVGYAVGGRSGPVEHFMEAWNNKDFAGRYIADPNDPTFMRVGARILHAIAPQMIVASNIDKLQSQGQGPGATLLGAAGFSPASKQLDMTPAELKAQQIMISHMPQGGKSEAEVNRGKAISTVMRAFRNKENPSAAIQEGFKSGNLRPSDLDVDNPYSIPNRIQTPYLTGMLKSDKTKLTDIISVYDLATKEERAQLRPLLMDHMADLGKMDPKSRTATVAHLREVLGAK